MRVDLVNVGVSIWFKDEVSTESKLEENTAADVLGDILDTPATVVGFGLAILVGVIVEKTEWGVFDSIVLDDTS